MTELQRPEVTTNVAQELIKLCYSTNTDVNLTNLVPRFDGNLGEGWAEIRSDHARVEFGGGFWHFGYELEQDKSVPSDSNNIWILKLYSEYDETMTLLRLSVPVSSNLTSNAANVIR